MDKVRSGVEGSSLLCVSLSPPPTASSVFAHTNQSVPSRAASDRPTLQHGKLCD